MAHAVGTLLSVNVGIPKDINAFYSLPIRGESPRP
jgi:hypothetical protein